MVEGKSVLVPGEAQPFLEESFGGGHWIVGIGLECQGSFLVHLGVKETGQDGDFWISGVGGEADLKEFVSGCQGRVTRPQLRTEQKGFFFLSIAALLTTVAVKYLLESQKDIKICSPLRKQNRQPNTNQTTPKVSTWMIMPGCK